MKRLRDDMVGKPTPVHEVCFAAVIGSLSSMCWGATVAGESGERVAAETMVAVANVMDMLGKPNVSDYFPFISWLDIQGIKRKTEIHTESLNRILDAVIAEYKNKSAGDVEIKKGKGDFVQILHEISEGEDAAGTLRIDQAHLKGMLADTLVAGIDITAATEWAMAELMNNLEVMAKAQKELSNVVGLTHIVEERHVPRLKYLEAVIKETLRLHPPVPFLLPRSPSIPSTVGGYTIPKDTCVFINAWSIHRDPTIWENPMKFKPERFLEENWNVSGNQCQYLPFGWGRRICAGRAIGEKMVLYVVASLVHSFDWVLPQDDKLDMSETFDIGLRKSTPLVIIPSPRSRHSSF